VGKGERGCGVGRPAHPRDAVAAGPVLGRTRARQDGGVQPAVGNVLVQDRRCSTSETQRGQL